VAGTVGVVVIVNGGGVFGRGESRWWTLGYELEDSTISDDKEVHTK
jgi:hypothetical protein